MLNRLIASFYKFIAYPLLRIYWFTLRPKTNSVEVIIQHQDQVLFVKNTYYQNNYWFLPGGEAKKNEKPEVAATRETREELNIDLKSLKNHGSFDFTQEYKKDTVWVLSTKIPNLNFKSDQKEIKEVIWIKIKDFPKFPLSPNTKKCLKLAHLT